MTTDPTSRAAAQDYRASATGLTPERLPEASDDPHDYRGLMRFLAEQAIEDAIARSMGGGHPPSNRPTAVGSEDGDRFDGIFQAIDRMDHETMAEFIRLFGLRYGVRVR